MGKIKHAGMHTTISYLQFPGIGEVEHAREKQIHVNVIKPFERAQVSM
jgi:hypothetical protein